MKDTTKNTNKVLLSMEHLNFSFNIQRGVVKAVRDLSLTIREGETLTWSGVRLREISDSPCDQSTQSHAAG